MDTRKSLQIKLKKQEVLPRLRYSQYYISPDIISWFKRDKMRTILPLLIFCAVCSINAKDEKCLSMHLFQTTYNAVKAKADEMNNLVEKLKSNLDSSIEETCGLLGMPGTLEQYSYSHKIIMNSKIQSPSNLYMKATDMYKRQLKSGLYLEVAFILGFILYVKGT